ncbi:Glucose-repressible alcohol dehydrogenase transcriptional effector [Pestalotiopsis fici W106-1]|uniref:CCR4-Not complex 3'-5'-exoribonuclease subunit Ccr4 n=1 Tax=Pestalotiopsis fici (strain W106-1 / CGMCC3.15140) TaxID=1229662 RepID=W3X6N7_PESFW|nr:Glucose-repressible alcohol dehydrogenase transcriptional effector [Pestalotiopsis fici W106-1]ETS80841.1 Glucose-repressible alcohol dehydrogenase transcriptional effector [Pestalotiopsis fici W106-1]
MYGPQQGHGSRLNGVPGGRAMAPQMMYGYVQSQSQHQHQHQHHAQQQQQQQQQHHHQQDHAANSAFSSGILSTAAPFTPSSHQNGVARTQQSQLAGELLSEQAKAYEESRRAHQSMTEQHQPHFFARAKAAENRGVGPVLPASITTPSNTNNGTGNDQLDGEEEDRGRPVNVDKNEDRQDWQSLDLSGQGLRAISLTVFDRYAFVEELYLCSNNLTYLPPAVGQLRKLRHLDLSNNHLTELPPELGMCTPLRKLLVFNNQIRDLPFELGALHHLELLGIQGNPLNSEMKQMLMEDDTKGLISYLKEQAPVPMPPEPRMPIPLQEGVSSNLERIRVLSWNTLCDRYATTAQYGYTPVGALDWEYRRSVIMDEFRQRDADILCLQEIAGDAFENFFTPELAQLDYRGVHYPKTRVSHMRDKTEQGLVDGCAIFFKNTKYILLDKQLVDFRSMAINRPDMKTTEDVFNRVMPKDNIGMFCFFESRATGARFIVVNAHLCWEGHLSDVKAVQTGILMEQITKMSEKYTRRLPISLSEKCLVRSVTTDVVSELDSDQMESPPAASQEYRSNTDIPLLVCGDYNSIDDSSVYELLDRGRVAPDHPDLVGHSYGNFTRDGISHPFSLRSAYAHVRNTPDDLTFTNYVPTFNGVIDYIWYSTNTLEATELLGPPDYNYLKRVPGFPNYHFPSDHIQIMADFVFKPRKEKKVAGDHERGSASRI